MSPQEWTAKGGLSVATLDPFLQGVLGGWKRSHTRGLSHRDKLLANTAYGCIGTGDLFFPIFLNLIERKYMICLLYTSDAADE